jgi:hypothetical protein
MLDMDLQKTRAQIKEMKAGLKMLEDSAENARTDMHTHYHKNPAGWESPFEEIDVRRMLLYNPHTKEHDQD